MTKNNVNDEIKKMKQPKREKSLITFRGMKIHIFFNRKKFFKQQNKTEN